MLAFVNQKRHLPWLRSLTSCRTTYRAVCTFERCQVRNETRIEEFGRRGLLAGCVGHVPQLFVVGVQQDDGTGGLHVEGGGGVQKSVLDQFDDASVRDGRFFLEVNRGAPDHGCF